MISNINIVSLDQQQLENVRYPPSWKGMAQSVDADSKELAELRENPIPGVCKYLLLIVQLRLMLMSTCAFG